MNRSELFPATISTCGCTRRTATGSGLRYYRLLARPLASRVEYSVYVYRIYSTRRPHKGRCHGPRLSIALYAWVPGLATRVRCRQARFYLLTYLLATSSSSAAG